MERVRLVLLLYFTLTSGQYTNNQSPYSYPQTIEPVYPTTSEVHLGYDRLTSSSTSALLAALMSSEGNSVNLIIPALIKHLESLSELAQRACLSLSQDCDQRRGEIRTLETTVSNLQNANDRLQTENYQLHNTTLEQGAAIRALQLKLQQNTNTLTQDSCEQQIHDTNYQLQIVIEEQARTEQQLRERKQQTEEENASLHHKINQLQSYELLQANQLQQQRERVRRLEEELGRWSQGEGGNANSYLYYREPEPDAVSTRTPWDCTEAMRQRETNGVYTIFPRGGGGGGAVVWCQWEDGRAWTVILARNNQSQPTQDFARSWPHYQYGFGLPDGEYWIGNEVLHFLTGGGVNYTLRVEATNKQGVKRSAEWRYFKVMAESDSYQLLLSDYNTESELGNALTNLNGTSFTTYDEDNDSARRNCAVRHGGGWWYRGCGLAFPTAPHTHTHTASQGHPQPTTRVLSWAYFGPRDISWTPLSQLKMMVAYATTY